MADRETWQYQGRQEHGWFGSGTAPQSDTGSTAGPTPGTGVAPPPYVASDPSQLLGRGQLGNGECVALVRRAAGAPATSSWRAGEAIEDHPVPAGIAALTFDPDGRYGNYTDQTSHALIVTEWTPRGFSAVEQFNIRNQAGEIVHRVAPRIRFYEFGHTDEKPVYNGSNYRVIR